MKLKKVYSIKLRSYDVLMIKSLVQLWKSSSKFFNLELNGPIIMPIKKSRIILLRSPHVYKKSREVFQFIEYKALINIVAPKNLDVKKIQNFIKLITTYLTPGVSFKLTKLI